MAEPRTPNDEEYLSPYSVKELFIEYCIREWEEPNFSESIGKNNLEAMSMLDSSALEALEPGAPLYSGPDLCSALQREVSSVGREAWLRRRISSSLQDVQLRNQVGVRLDEDLNAVGMSHMTGIETSMKEKVSSHVCSGGAVAEHQPCRLERLQSTGSRGTSLLSSGLIPPSPSR